jgi:hypothetical protein
MLNSRNVAFTVTGEGSVLSLQAGMVSAAAMTAGSARIKAFDSDLMVPPFAAQGSDDVAPGWRLDSRVGHAGRSEGLKTAKKVYIAE